MVLGGLLAQGGMARADTDDDAPLPPVFDKTVPENKQDLLAIQGHVQGLLKKTRRATVGLMIGGAQGSGIIITKDGKILTAGHVSGRSGRNVEVSMPDGRTLKGKTLGANYDIDSGMIQITDKGDYPYCEMADSAELKTGQWCMAIGHPGGVQKGRDPVVRLGRVQEIGKSFIRTDCALVGGDSGGPLFDMHGKVIGIHSRIGNLITANIHVPVSTYRDTWDRLAASEEWGFGFGKAAGAYLGINVDPDSKECRIASVTPTSPAAQAGLKINDVILRFDSKKIASRDDLMQSMQNKRPDTEVTLEVRRGDDKITLRVKLGKRAG
jgi:serine protease Do